MKHLWGNIKSSADKGTSIFASFFFLIGKQGISLVIFVEFFLNFLNSLLFNELFTVTEVRLHRN
jgi:hypothetical protein